MSSTLTKGPRSGQTVDHPDRFDASDPGILATLVGDGTPLVILTGLALSLAGAVALFSLHRASSCPTIRHTWA